MGKTLFLKQLLQKALRSRYICGVYSESKDESDIDFILSIYEAYVHGRFCAWKPLNTNSDFQQTLPTISHQLACMLFHQWYFQVHPNAQEAPELPQELLDTEITLSSVMQYIAKQQQTVPGHNLDYFSKLLAGKALKPTFVVAIDEFHFNAVRRRNCIDSLQID